MIKTDIVANVSSNTLEGELIVPSAVLTSTPQEEEINLTYTPNFQLKLMDKNSYAVDDVLVSFSYADTNYTAYMNVVNRTQDGIVTLQYNNGLTSKEIPPQPEPEPEPVDPLDSTLTITGPLTPNSDGIFDSIVYSQETQDVYMKSKGMTYDSDNNRYEFVLDVQSAVQQYYAPITHWIESITFVDLDSTYKDALLQMTSINSGVLTEDGDGNLRWSTSGYDPVIGLEAFDFTEVIKEQRETMTFEEIRITLIPRPQRSVILTSANIRTAQGDPETSNTPYQYQGNGQTPINTIDENLFLYLKGDPAITCYNLTDGTNSNIVFEAGSYLTIEGTGNHVIVQVIITLNPDYDNDTSELDVQPNEDNQLIFDNNSPSFGIGGASTPLYITQIKVSYIV